MIAAVLCFTLSSALNQANYSDGEIKMGYCFLALAIGMIAPCLMSTKHATIRYFKGNYDPISQAIDGFLIEYSIFSICYLV